MKEVGACKCLLVKKVWLPMVGNVSGDERQKHFGQWRWLWTTYDCSLFWASSLAAALLHFVGGRGKTQGLTVYTWRNSFTVDTFSNRIISTRWNWTQNAEDKEDSSRCDAGNTRLSPLKCRHRCVFPVRFLLWVCMSLMFFFQMYFT